MGAERVDPALWEPTVLALGRDLYCTTTKLALRWVSSSRFAPAATEQVVSPYVGESFIHTADGMVVELALGCPASVGLVSKRGAVS